MAEEGAPGGGGITKKVGPLPVWAWAVGAGAIVGLIWFLRQRSSAGSGVTDPSAATDAGDGSSSDPTTIVPYQQGGVSEAQWQQLFNAITALHGPASTPGPVETNPANGDSKTPVGVGPFKLPTPVAKKQVS